MKVFCRSAASEGLQGADGVSRKHFQCRRIRERQETDGYPVPERHPGVREDRS